MMCSPLSSTVTTYFNQDPRGVYHTDVEDQEYSGHGTPQHTGKTGKGRRED